MRSGVKLLTGMREKTAKNGFPVFWKFVPVQGSPEHPAQIKQSDWKKFLKTACPEEIV